MCPVAVFVAVKESTTGSSQLAVDADDEHLKLQTKLGNGNTSPGHYARERSRDTVGLAYQFEY